ncbi:MAG: surface-adhesin E family protein [Nitrosomonadaceae bacterium]
MRNAILMAILAMISTSAIGEWIKVDRNKNAGITRYVDITTVHKMGNNVKMLDLIDYITVREAMEDKFLSIKVLQEYDCNEVKKRILAFNTYSGNMGYGGVLYANSKPNKWEIISSPRSVSLTLWEIACSR